MVIEELHNALHHKYGHFTVIERTVKWKLLPLKPRITVVIIWSMRALNNFSRLGQYSLTGIALHKNTPSLRQI